jgi:hypothetical protein
MPPEGYTMVTVSEATAGKLAEIIVAQDLESMLLLLITLLTSLAIQKPSRMPN